MKAEGTGMKGEDVKQEGRCGEADSALAGRKVDREALVAAIETELPLVQNFMDLRTGEVLTVVGPVWTSDADEDEPDQIARDNRRLALRIRAEADCYAHVPAIAPEAGFRWMQEFAASVADQSLRERLQKLLRDCTDDCFEAFRGALAEVPDEERERWFAFRNEKMEEFVNAWLNGLGF